MSIVKDIVLFGVLASRKKVTRQTLLEVWDDKSFGQLGDRNTLRNRFDRLETAFNVKISCDRNGFYYIEGDEHEFQSSLGAMEWAFHNLVMLQFMKEFRNKFKDLVTTVAEPANRYLMEKVMTAIGDNYRLNVKFMNFMQSEVKWIEPWGMILSNDRWLVVGRSNLSEEEKLEAFEVSKISYAELTRTKFVRPAHFSIDDWLTTRGYRKESISRKFVIYANGADRDRLLLNPLNQSQHEVEYGKFEVYSPVNESFVRDLVKLAATATVELPDQFLDCLQRKGNLILFNGHAGVA